MHPADSVSSAGAKDGEAGRGRCPYPEPKACAVTTRPSVAIRLSRRMGEPPVVALPLLRPGLLVRLVLRVGGRIGAMDGAPPGPSLPAAEWLEPQRDKRRATL